MIRFIAAVCAAAFALLSASCGCCTSDVNPPGLRPLPQFQEIVAPQIEVEYSK